MSSKNIIFEGVFVTVLSTVHESYLCILCSNILNNPYHSPCGCRFCFQCINDYLKEELLPCPGKSEDCFGIQLNINKDIKPDILAKREINKLMVKCPFYKCNYEYQLRDLKGHIEECGISTTVCTVCGETVIRNEFLNHEDNECKESIVRCEYCNETMKRKYLNDASQNVMQNDIFSQYTDHRMVCRSQMVPCPYKFIGCTVNNTSFIVISKHLVEKGIYHAELILKHMDNINNEVIHLNNETTSERNEVTSVINEFCIQRINEIQDQNNKITDLNNAIDEMKRTNLTILPQFHNIIKNENKNVTVQINTTQNLALVTVNKNIEGLRHEVNLLKANNGKEFSKIIENAYTENTDLRTELSELKERIIVIEKYLTIKQENIRLDWIIEDFTKKHSEYSPNFYTHPMGYKMNLNVEKKVKGFLSIYAYLKSGNYDDELSWPFRKKLIIKILDQDRMGNDVEKEVLFNSTVGHVCDRPISNVPKGYGFSHFISYSTLRESKYLLRNENMWIQCVVEDLDV